MNASLGDGAAFSVMVGMGETYLPAFALAIGMGEITAGLLASGPMIAGAVLQLVSPAAVLRLGSHRRWVVLCAAVQGLAFVPLLAAALVGSIPTAALFVIAAIYWGAGLAAAPAWNTWMGRVVPVRLRARFFARRTRAAQFAVLAGLLAGGVTLQIASAAGRPLTAFAILFLVSGGFRLISARLLAMHSEPAGIAADQRTVGVLALMRRSIRHDGRVFLYILCVQFAVQIAAPFFTPYMISHLRLPYGGYMTLVAAAFVARIVALPALGRIAQRHGARRLLWIGGAGITPLAAYWLVSDSFWYLLAIQLVSGTAWAAYELATFLLLFETIPESERTSTLTSFNLVNAAAMVTGALAGSGILHAVGAGPRGYVLVFAVSSIGRMLTLLLLGRVADVRFRWLPIATRTVAVRPSAGAIDRPVLPSLPSEQAAAERLELHGTATEKR